MKVQRLFGLAYLVLITFAAILAADMVKASLRTWLTAPVTSNVAPVGKQTGALTSKAPLSQYEVIAKRNLFNANPPSDTPAPPPSIAPPPPPPTTEVQGARLELRLVGVVTGGKVQRYAILEDTKNRGVQALYHIGDVIEQSSIVDMDKSCVYFETRGQREKLCFEQEGEAESKAESRATPPSSRPRAAAVQPPAAESSPEGIVRVDDGTWRVSQELMAENFANLGSLSSQARIVPHIVQGQPQGFRFVRLNQGSLLQQIGFLNGDVLQRINGLNIHSPEEALAAYQQLQSEGTVRVEILRQNQPHTLTYEIR